MKRLPITEAQRKRIEYRARLAENRRMIRAFRGQMALFGVPLKTINDIVTCVLALPSGSEGQR